MIFDMPIRTFIISTISFLFAFYCAYKLTQITTEIKDEEKRIDMDGEDE